MASVFDDDSFFSDAYDASLPYVDDTLWPSTAFDQPILDTTNHAAMNPFLQRVVLPDQLADPNAPMCQLTASCATCCFEVCLCALCKELEKHKTTFVPDQPDPSCTSEYEQAFATDRIKRSKNSPKHNNGEPNRPKTRATKTKRKRAWISDVARSILEGQFLKDPYPNKDAIVSLQGETELPERTIQTWFSNTRSRKPAFEDTSNSGERSPSRLSSTSLKALDRISAAGSQVSLERWLAEPKDPAISASGPLFLEMSTGVENSGPDSFASMPSEPYNSKPGSRYGSRAGSVRSKGSAASRGSQSSFRSVDLRGNRRGRRQWKEQIRLAGAPKGAIFCTWPTCPKFFSTRFEWIRHEEAIHYCPYRWICCYNNGDEEEVFECFVCKAENVTLRHITENHFQNCNHADEPQRVFWRSDQLIQHVKRAHGYVGLPLGIVQGWKSSNPAFDERHLKCGFCGHENETWEQRNHHVFEDIVAGATKESWWPAGMSALGPYVWSCRGLADSLYVIDASLDSPQCSLCGSGFTENGIDLHVASHRLLDCDQRGFSDFDTFLSHLIADHGASELIIRETFLLAGI